MNRLGENIKIYNDGEEVFEGRFEEYLTANMEESDYLLTIVKHVGCSEITFMEHSGEWLIQFQ